MLQITPVVFFIIFYYYYFHYCATCVVCQEQTLVQVPVYDYYLEPNVISLSLFLLLLFGVNLFNIYLSKLHYAYLDKSPKAFSS